ncbi:MAG: Gfo/Idh/MocA family oxidoreductase [Propionibacteriaceae bacterium]|nr:Gfo/Idh/MocA family oxidoreductase [Propionibacteriaceae bacterium]
MTPDNDVVLRVGIVGCGNIARSHARAYAENPHVELVACHDIDHPSGRDFADTFASTHVDSVAALLATGVDLVSIATPPGSHADLACELLAGGTHVLIEKPATISLAELDRVAEAERASGRTAHVVLQHRHGTGAIRAHDLLGAGRLGRPRVAVCETLWYRTDGYFTDVDWRGHWAGEGGGPTLGHAIHQIDLLLHLLGEWESVEARAVRLARPVQFEDASLAIVTFASGAVASVVTSLVSPREVSRIRVDTDAGTLEVEHLYGYSDADWAWTPVADPEVAARFGLDPGQERNDDPDADAVASDPWTATEDSAHQVPSNHAAQINRLVDDLLAGRPHATTLASARSTMELVTAVYASGLGGGTVRRTDLTPGNAFYDCLDGGLDAATVDDRLNP